MTNLKKLEDYNNQLLKLLDYVQSILEDLKQKHTKI